MNTKFDIRRNRQSGLSLIELMIAMTIGLFLIGGAMLIFVTSSDTRRTNDDIARMQENTRFAMDTIKPDVRMAGLWGLTSITGTLNGYAGSASELSTIASDCEDRWYIKLTMPIEGFNDNNPYSATCLSASDYMPGTDILVVRHASTEIAPALNAGVIYIRTDATRGEIFEGTTPPSSPFAAGAEDHRLLVHAYYVRPYTFATDDDIPSLHRLTLTDDGAGTTVIEDEEVVPGIEDFQIQFGVDDTGDGSINRYVNPETAGLITDNIRAVRLWLMARSTRAERSFVNDATYDYASKSVKPNDNFRRLLTSTTIMLRNDDSK